MTRPAGTPPPSLRVQTVLYRTPPEAVDRFRQAVSAACALARRSGAIGSATLWIGDSSPAPLVGAGGESPVPVPTGAGAPEEVADGLDQVHYLHFGANLGSAGGHNRLFRDMTEDLVLVVNPDTYAAPRLVAELVAGLADPTVGVVEARQLPLEHPKAHDPETGDTSWASGSCFLARAQVVRAIGGFDARLFFLHGDDVDFSWRARLAGWRVVHRPTARIFHDKRLSDDGVILAGEGELEHSARVRVLLPWRYDRRDLALAALAALEAAPDELSRRVGAELRARIDAGDMPEAIDHDHVVAQFVRADYAEHRFSYADP
jgi:GT2 family glycosyltransferase